MNSLKNDLLVFYYKNKSIVFAVLLALYLIINIIQSIVQPFWTDELFTVWSVSFDNLNTFFVESIVKDVHPPLYNAFLYFWVRLFGVSELSIRFPSVIAGLLSIMFFYKTIKSLYNEEIAVISTTFFLTFTFPVYFATEARSYSILLMFTILLFNIQHIIFKGLENNNKINLKHGLLLSVLLLILGYLHYFGLFIACFSILYFCLLLDYRKLLKVSIFYIVFIIGYLPWVSIAVHHASYGKLWMEPLVLKAFYSILSYLLLNNNILSLVPILLILAYSIRLLMKLVRSAKSAGIVETVKKSSLEIYFALIIFVPFFIFYVLTHIMTPFFTYKHYFFAIPCLYVFLAESLTAVNHKYLKYGLFAFILISSVISNVFIQKYTGIFKTDYKSASEYIDSNQKDDSSNLIAVYGLKGIVQSAYISSYYFDNKPKMVSFQGEPANVEKLADSLSNSENKNIWLLADHNFRTPVMVSSIEENFKILNKKKFQSIDVLLLQAKADKNSN